MKRFLECFEGPLAYLLLALFWRWALNKLGCGDSFAALDDNPVCVFYMFLGAFAGELGASVHEYFFHKDGET